MLAEKLFAEKFPAKIFENFQNFEEDESDSEAMITFVRNNNAGRFQVLESFDPVACCKIL